MFYFKIFFQKNLAPIPVFLKKLKIKPKIKNAIKEFFTQKSSR